MLGLLVEGKAEDIVDIDIAGKSDIADYLVVASGRSSRQVVALCEKITESLKAVYGMTVGIEGKQQGDWVLIDAGDIIVHLFRPEVREYYQLEKMWLPEAPSDPSR
ncbi:MAG: ribosome silencing factor [Rhodobacteraceae bacterium]|nr:ribosome silencing factor [Paracoccaceae bacterium]